MDQEEIDKTHPGFTITCNNCKSTRVTVENSLGFSALSGSWGSVDLACLDCKAFTEIVES